MTGTHRALVVGDTVAGAVLAFWLRRAGWDVEVVTSSVHRTAPDAAPVDLGGVAGEVVDRMGLAEDTASAALPACATDYEMTDGRRLPVVDDDVGGRVRRTRIQASDLRELVQQAAGVHPPDRDHVDAVGTSPTGVHAYCHSGAERRSDVLVVADGLRSPTRSLVLERDTEVVAAPAELLSFTLPEQADCDHLRRRVTAARRRSATVQVDARGRTLVQMVHLPHESGELRDASRPDRLAYAEAVFGDVPWGSGTTRGARWDALRGATDVVHHTFGSVRVAGRWSHGRSVLLGDAAHGATGTDGPGTALDVVAAYVLAGELTTQHDPALAFISYEARMRPLAEAAQARRWRRLRRTHPRTRLGVRLLHERHGSSSYDAWDLGISMHDIGHPALPRYDALTG